jgi:hypothetical protein
MSCHDIYAQPILKLIFKACAFQLEAFSLNRFHVGLLVVPFLEFVFAGKINRFPIEKSEEHVSFARAVQQERARQR